jgi:hypothetical protein
VRPFAAASAPCFLRSAQKFFLALQVGILGFRSGHLAIPRQYFIRRIKSASLISLLAFIFSTNPPPQSIVAVPVKDLGNTLEFGTGQTLVSQWTVLSTPFYSVFPDGQKLLMERVSQQVSQPLTVVTNFTAQLRK